MTLGYENPPLRTYCKIKHTFRCEPYLLKVQKTTYRVALSRLRTSSHTLEIERGRHTKPKTKINDRLCSECKTLEDESHFLIVCNLYASERQKLFNKIYHLYPYFKYMNNEQKFKFLLENDDSQILTWVGGFIHH